MSKKIKLIVGSTRQGRVGDRIAHWFVNVAKENGVEVGSRPRILPGKSITVGEMDLKPSCVMCSSGPSVPEQIASSTRS